MEERLEWANALKNKKDAREKKNTWHRKDTEIEIGYMTSATTHAKMKNDGNKISRCMRNQVYIWVDVTYALQWVELTCE